MRVALDCGPLLDLPTGVGRYVDELDDPDESRFVQRVRDESHNCWTASCAADAQTLREIVAWAEANPRQPASQAG